MSTSQERELLYKLRSKLAYETKNRNSWSFSNEELENLLKVKPKTLEELATVKGFPIDGKRVKAFGKDILDIFKGVPIKEFGIKLEGEVLTVKQELTKSRSFLRMKK